MWFLEGPLLILFLLFHGACAAPNATTTTLSLRETTNAQSPNTAVAMIVLYAVTGCVSLLFCTIIISGAVRAIRHPERYGPRGRRSDGENDWGEQSRARGLTRAILDTFPIVKFATTRDSEIKDAENAPGENKLDQNTEEPKCAQGQVLCPTSGGCSSPNPDEAKRSALIIATAATPNDTLRAVGAKSLPRLGDSSSQLGSVSNADVMPAAIGRETCPICIVDFEEGDDLRVLPCDGAHRFHQTCVDPWLLELSTACPICRHDFLALETMISGGSNRDDLESSQARDSRIRRFSRYLRFATHRREMGVGDLRPNRSSTHSMQTYM
ncbi:hypothetical protein B0H10DRAFT_2002290 [Mycena sp. CBHHK59/15]|nr:hypothetical protein B0H10DRAFT_2002290 [Mycena sp. CBHHK59/15]